MLPEIFREINICDDLYPRKKCENMAFDYFIVSLKGECPVRYMDSPGVSNIPVKIDTNIYIVNTRSHDTRLTANNISLLLNDVNRIWGQYNFSFNVRNITIHNLDDKVGYVTSDDSDLFKLTKQVIGNDVHNRNTTELDIILIQQFKGIQLFFVEFLGSATEGRGLRGLNDKPVNLIVVTINSKNISWNLAHEIGHILGSLDKSEFVGEYNLMTHQGCVKNLYYPTLLNQTEINTAVVTAIQTHL